MKTFVDNFPNQSSGDMDAYGHNANPKNLGPSVAPEPDAVFTNVGDVTRIYRHNQNANAQHQAAVMEVAFGYYRLGYFLNKLGLHITGYSSNSRNQTGFQYSRYCSGMLRK